jgi:hypothetical protein
MFCLVAFLCLPPGASVSVLELYYLVVEELSSGLVFGIPKIK